MNAAELIGIIKSREKIQKCAIELLEFAKNSAPDEITGFFERAREAGISSTGVAYYTLYVLIKNGHEGLVDAVCALAGEDDLLYGVYCLARAFVEFKSFKLESGERLMRAGLLDCLKKTNEFSSESFDDITFALQNIFLLERVAWPSSDRFKAPPLDIVYENRRSNSPYTCFITCDCVYFDNYADRFIKSLRAASPDAGVFILIVNPTEEIINRAKLYEGIIVAKTSYKGRWIAEFSASVRFVLANDILSAIGGPTIFMDIDSKFPEGSAEILSILSKQSLGVCDTGELYPWTKIQATVLCANPTKDAFEFFEAARDCILEDFTREGPLWGFDQVALFRAVCLGKSRGWGIVELNELMGGKAGMPYFFMMGKDETMPLESRRAKRTNRHYEFMGMDGQGKTFFQKKRDEKWSGAMSRWEWLAEGKISVSEVFLDSGAASAAIYEPAEDVKAAEMLIDDLLRHGVRISGLIFDSRDGGLCEKYSLARIAPEEIGSGSDIDFMVVVSDENYFETRMELQGRTNAEVISLLGLINLVSAKYKYDMLPSHAVFYRDNGIKACVLDWPQVEDFGSADLYENISRNAFSTAEHRTNPERFKSLYDDVAEYSDEYISEIFQERPLMRRGDRIVHADCRGKYVNIVDGARVTVGQPDDAECSVYVTGGCMAWGFGADDRYTVSSFLQKYANDYYGSVKNSKCAVYNFGAWGAEDLFFDEFARNDNKPQKIAIMIFRSDLGYPKGGVGRVHRYIKRFMADLGFDYIDLAQTLKDVEERIGTYIDMTHTNHRGYRAVARKVFDDFLKPILDAGCQAAQSEQDSFGDGLAVAEKWRMLSLRPRSRAEFFASAGVASVGVFCAQKGDEMSVAFLKELQDSGVAVKYFISGGINQAMNADFPHIPNVRIEDLQDANKVDMVVVIGDDEIIDVKRRIGERIKVETVYFKDILNMTWDRYFFYPKIAREFSKSNAYVCLLQWPDISELGLSLSDAATAAGGKLGADDLQGSCAYLAANLYEDIPGFSIKYLSEVFSGGTAHAKGKYLNARDGIRFTEGAPANFTRTVWLFGGDVAFGMGSEDKYTIASLLQKQIGEYEQKQCLGRSRVVNLGIGAGEADDRHVFEKAIAPALQGGGIKDGDIILWIADRRYSLGERDKKAYSYLRACLEDYGIEVVDLAKTLALAQKNKRVFVDGRRVNHRGNLSVATKIFFDCVKNILDGRQPIPDRAKKPSNGFAEDPALNGEQNAEFKDYLCYLAKEKVALGRDAGAVVMNCNPFTNGHRSLVERAASEVDFLYVFVVEEDQSFFKFADRFRLVCEGLSGMKNVKVLKSGKFIISTITFPGYFTKDSPKEVAVDASLDLSLFAKYIAPELGIGVRFAGSEPIDEVTRQYNKAMRDTLPRHGIKFVEYERIFCGKEPISASRVRALLEKKDFDAIRPLVPDATYNYLLENF